MKKELKEEIEKLNRKLKKGRHFKTKYWELFYPDGTSSVMNYNPLKKAEEEIEKIQEIEILKLETLKQAKEDFKKVVIMLQKQVVDCNDGLLKYEKEVRRLIKERIKNYSELHKKFPKELKFLFKWEAMIELLGALEEK